MAKKFQYTNHNKNIKSQHTLGGAGEGGKAFMTS